MKLWSYLVKLRRTLDVKLLDRQNDFEAFRIWSRACGKLGEPRAYMAAAEFFNDPRATRDDLLEALRLILSG